MNAVRLARCVLFAGFAMAGAVQVGQQAPGFSLATSGGDTFDLSRQSGSVVVLYFLGCT